MLHKSGKTDRRTYINIIHKRTLRIQQQLRKRLSRLNYRKCDNFAMHCNMRPPDAAPVLIRFNYNAHAKFEVDQPIRYRRIAFLLLIRYVTL